MRFIRQGVHSGSIDPTVIEIEQSANRDGVVDGFVCPAVLVEELDVRWADVLRMLVHFADETKQGLFVVRKRGGFEIAEHPPN